MPLGAQGKGHLLLSAPALAARNQGWHCSWSTDGCEPMHEPICVAQAQSQVLGIRARSPELILCLM